MIVDWLVEAAALIVFDLDSLAPGVSLEIDAIAERGRQDATVIVLPAADASASDSMQDLEVDLLGLMGAQIPGYERPAPDHPRPAGFTRVAREDEIPFGDLRSSPLFADLLADAADRAPAAQRARLADAWGILRLAAEQTLEAAETFQLAAQLFHEAADPQGNAAALMNLGRAFLDAGYYDGAIEVFRAAGTTSDKYGDRKGFARAAAWAGLAHMQNGDLPQALAYAEYGLQLDREGEEADITTEALKVLWRVYEQMDDPELARRSLEELKATERRLEQRAATPPRG